MEEKILEIIKTNQIFLAGHSELCAKEITAHVMEFIEWIFDNCYLLYPFADSPSKYIVHDEIGDKTYTLEELYQYWLNNVKK